MSIITEILAVFVALEFFYIMYLETFAEFFYIMYLETFATTSDKTSQVFQMSKEELSRDSVKTLFKNQGVYNGLISILILLALFVFTSKIAIMILMGYIILVALYGAITSNPKILLMQGGLAILTLISALF
ncbi:DUF1304 domain-containing protein [uncultured Sharpea sp.]|uniref:DUF1304 domain-containing protein n=1 Tax=uncultured Sharpea sp. TaxID=1112738 RepID=UPI002582C53B|nr:DUF1304 domain-containing protein [uncultured Sharpea sp.]